MGIRVGIDTGGTFTDLVGVDEDSNQLIVSKRPSTPRNPEQGVFDALATSRQSLLRALVNYNIAISSLERAKGTLLEYNNVTLVD